ncbi:hypothetical protein V8E52_007136 [Russula decolorans]
MIGTSSVYLCYALRGVYTLTCVPALDAIVDCSRCVCCETENSRLLTPNAINPNKDEYCLIVCGAEIVSLPSPLA